MNRDRRRLPAALPMAKPTVKEFRRRPPGAAIGHVRVAAVTFAEMVLAPAKESVWVRGPVA